MKTQIRQVLSNRESRIQDVMDAWSHDLRLMLQKEIYLARKRIEKSDPVNSRGEKISKGWFVNTIA